MYSRAMGAPEGTAPEKVVLRPVTLSFPDRALEKAFQLDSARKVQWRHRVTWLLSAALWSLLALLDPVTSGSPGNLKVILAIRLAVLPAFVATAAVGWLPLEKFARWRHVSAAACASIGLWSVLAMGLAVPDPERLDMASGPVSFAVAIIAVCFIWSTRLAVSFVVAVPVTLATPLMLLRYSSSEVVPTLFWFAAAAVMGGIGSWRFEVSQRYSFLQRKWLSEERARSEALLHNLLPRVIADRLKATSGRIAEHHESATILFCDIVGFTELAESTEPVTLVETLDRIFSSFDDLAQTLGLEKIKTIGDAYMVAGGLPSSTPDHAEAVAEMALAIRDTFTSELLPGQRLRVRIGIHTGPVIAGVIGKKKLVYDLWGDTVNTASRMESHSLPGRIHVTRTVFEILRADYDFEGRGQVDVKGKGTMETFFLNSRRGT